jgi:peptidoglycan/LPS O-acetylase OafA/YrhL
MVFSTALMPFALPKVAKMDKKALRKSLIWLGLINLLPVLGYCLDSNTWGLVEGMTAPKKHPALAVFNYQRFLPMFNVAEVLMGAVTCRLAMLDGMVDVDSKDKPSSTPNTSWLSTTVPFVGLLAIMAGRAFEVVPACSDLLVRGLIFTPLFLKFVLGAHRNTVGGKEDFLLNNILSSKALVWLGGLSFPIYIVHGPIGQVFYKKLIATKLWGGVLWGPPFFVLYMTTVMVSAILVNKFFLQNKAVGSWSKARIDQWSSWM